MSSPNHCQVVSRSHRRAPILRVRTGCLTCRGRKKKCDERKPVCTGCSRNHLTCRWPPDRTQPRERQAEDLHKHSRDGNDEQSLSVGSRLSSSRSTDSCTSPDGEGGQEASQAAEKVSPFAPSESCNVEIRSPVEQLREAAPESPEPPFTSPLQVSSPQLREHIQATADCPTHSASGDSLGDRIQNRGVPELDYETPGLLGLPATDLMLTVGMQSIPASPSLIPGLQTRQFQLLGHYVSCTALSMGNGSTIENPFITQMVPLMFANNLILRLVLAQSASHQAIAGGDALDIAQQDYAGALRIFQSAIDEYVDGRERSPLWVTIGALIMCFTEVRVVQTCLRTSR